MKRVVKTIIKFFFVIVISFLLLSVFSRYGWKLFGFSMCNAPTAMYADHIAVEKDKVNLRLNEAYSISSYAGYIYKIEDDSLYIGINRNKLFAIFNGKIDYQISIPTNNTEIKYIYFRDNKNDWLIWNEDDGRIKATEIKPRRY